MSELTTIAKQLRLNRNKTQQQVADLVDITDCALSYIENTNVKFERLQDIAEALNYKIEIVITDLEN